MRYFLLALLFATQTLSAQQYAMTDLMATPYISNLTAARKGNVLLFTANQQGKRNVFIASGQTGKTYQLTKFNEDDGLEITSLSISPNAEWAVFARGGDHGANSAARPINPASYTNPQKIQVYSVRLATAELKLLAEGDFPIIHPQSGKVVFLRENQPYVVPIDGSHAAKPLFQTRGNVSQMQWNQDGSAMVFTARRDAHSFIGIYRENSPRIQWVAPSFSRDDYPCWSPDGKQIAFIRQPAAGGVSAAQLMKRNAPWSIMVASAEGESCQEVWKAPQTPRTLVPIVQKTLSLRWPQADRLLFLTRHEGWVHFCTVNPSDSKFQLLTKGKFAIEDIALSADGKLVAFSANTGNTPQDIDRRHIGIVPVAGGEMQLLTPGEGIETNPCFTNNDTEIALLSSTPQRPILPAIYSLSKKGAPALMAKELLGNFNYNQLVTPQQVSFTAPDGLSINAQLFLPKKASAKAPAIVYVHGGPRRQMYLGWHNVDYYFYDYQTNQYLANLGFVVLSVNYRLGSGYGHEFQNPANAGAGGASEYQDIVAAAGWLAKQEQVDSAAIGIYGGSYGGYLTGLALGRNSDIFKVGVDIHGMHNRKTKPNAADPQQAARIAWESSPSGWVQQWTSPVLIIHADDDQNVPISQSIDVVNRLKAKGVPAEYMVIPDDTHHWMIFANLVKVKKATVGYLQQHLMNK